MTEDEAKTKWCPMARNESETSSFNRDINGFHSRNDKIPYSPCIASACMMWQVGIESYRDRGNDVPASGSCGLTSPMRN